MVKEHVAGLDVSMNYAFAVAVLEASDYLPDVEADILLGQQGIEFSEVHMLDILHYNRRRAVGGVDNKFFELNYMRSILQSLHDAGLPAHFVLLDWF